MPFEDPNSFLFGLNQFASPPGNSPNAGGAGSSALNSRHDSLLTGLESFGESAPGANGDDGLLGQGTFADQLALWTNANFSFDGPTGHALLADDDKDKDKDGDLDAGREADEADRKRAQARAENRETEAALFQRQREANERRAEEERHQQHNPQQINGTHDQHRASQPNTAPPTPLITQQQTYFGGSLGAAAPSHQQHARRPSELHAHNAPSPSISQAQFAAQLQAQLQHPFPVNNPFWNGAGSTSNPLQALLYQQQPQHLSQLQGQMGQPQGRPSQPQPPLPANIDLNTLLALQQALSSINGGSGQPASAQVTTLLGQLSNPQVQAALSQLQQPQHQHHENGHFSRNGSLNIDTSHAPNGISNPFPPIPGWQPSGNGVGTPHAPEFPAMPNGAGHGPGPLGAVGRQSSFHGRHTDNAHGSADEGSNGPGDGERQAISRKKKARTSPDSGQGDSSDNAREQADSSADADAPRFRVKKKQREAALEATSRELRTRLADLEQENSRLRTENGWLKGLIHVKPEQGSAGGASTSVGAAARAATTSAGSSATSSFVPRSTTGQAQGSSNADTAVSRLRDTGLHPRGVGTESATPTQNGSAARASNGTSATIGAASTHKNAAATPAVASSGATKRDRED
ncbi:possible bzip transcription factor [Ceraceosorus bombacis]|uniref:Possible bzip transcription factor n=1 Tax=Ceraceosorus bombacis TaxID=401625 RepID=A0A0P1BIB4_9BASI|nr:possible bzip transcription factor [Ceraceosorus bombacis]